ncbi:hypothetical protein PUN28_013294 [Cardiocondyla obscurior]|uniref:Uncharacterized protein n=1 Tax=Cardiocondyla obscurior TaxID=286306 RepID=A0AAW2F9S8_9HYME
MTDLRNRELFGSIWRTMFVAHPEDNSRRYFMRSTLARAHIVRARHICLRTANTAGGATIPFPRENSALFRTLSLSAGVEEPLPRVDLLMVIGPISNEPLEDQRHDIDLNNPWGRTNALIRWARSV